MFAAGEKPGATADFAIGGCRRSGAKVITATIFPAPICVLLLAPWS